MHDDVIKWKHFLRYWSFVRGIHRLPVNSPHKGQWCGTLMFSLICAWINGWVKQSRGWWFETPSRALWRHCNCVSVNLYFQAHMHNRVTYCIFQEISVNALQLSRRLVWTNSKVFIASRTIMLYHNDTWTCCLGQWSSASWNMMWTAQVL